MSLTLTSSNGTDTAVAGLAANPLALRIPNIDADWVLTTDTLDRKVYTNSKGPMKFQDSIIVVFTPISDMYKGLNISETFKTAYRTGLNVMWQYNGFHAEVDSNDASRICYVPFVVRNTHKIPLHPGYSAAIALRDQQTLACLPWAKSIAATSGQVIVDLMSGVRKY